MEREVETVERVDGYREGRKADRREGGGQGVLKSILAFQTRHVLVVLGICICNDEEYSTTN